MMFRHVSIVFKTFQPFVIVCQVDVKSLPSGGLQAAWRCQTIWQSFPRLDIFGNLCLVMVIVLIDFNSLVHKQNQHFCLVLGSSGLCF